MAPATISPNCEQVYFNIPVNVSGNVTIQINNGSEAAQSFDAFASGGTVQININFLSKGVVTYKVLQGDSVVYTGYVIATCEIDCCIAKLVESAITCTCHCDKCKEELDRAEKIHLLLIAAKHAAEVEQNFEDATAKYNKAKEFCTEVCACGC